MYAGYTSDELYHHGIKGMKWGVRRYRDKAGNLTSRGKKKISKKYKKLNDNAMSDLKKSYNDIWVKSYNKTANDMNKGGVEKFNKAQEKKYGSSYTKREGYVDDYQKEFDRQMNKYFNQSVKEFSKNNKNVNAARKMVHEYNMLDWNDLAKSEAKAYEKMFNTRY